MPFSYSVLPLVTQIRLQNYRRFYIYISVFLVFSKRKYRHDIVSASR